MRAVCIADFHGHLINPPVGDVLIIAGDISPYEIEDRPHEMKQWCERTLRPWLLRMEEQYKFGVVAVAGNHDFFFERHPYDVRYLPWAYLDGEIAEVGGARFYGTPRASTIGDWAFVSPDASRSAEFAEQISAPVDVIVSHGPPYGCRDNVHGELTGSRSLREAIVQHKPELVVCGHIHEAHGQDMIGRTLVVNAALLDKRMKMTNHPIIVDFEPSATLRAA